MEDSEKSTYRNNHSEKMRFQFNENLSPPPRFNPEPPFEKTSAPNKTYRTGRAHVIDLTMEDELVDSDDDSESNDNDNDKRDENEGSGNSGSGTERTSAEEVSSGDDTKSRTASPNTGSIADKMQTDERAADKTQTNEGTAQTNKRKASTSEEKYTMKDFLHSAPFTQTEGNFEMDDILESIDPGSPRKRVKRDAFDAKSNERGHGEDSVSFKRTNRGKASTTFEPVNTEIPRTFTSGPSGNTISYDFCDSDKILMVHPPRSVPVPPENLSDSSALEAYGHHFAAYMRQWNEYKNLVTLYQSGRDEADRLNNEHIMQDNLATLKYMKALDQDSRVNEVFLQALNQHRHVMQQYQQVHSMVYRSG